MTTNERLAALAAQPKTHRVTSVFSDGLVRTFDAHCEAAAKAYADARAQFIGKSPLVSVTIELIQ